MNMDTGHERDERVMGPMGDGHDGWRLWWWCVVVRARAVFYPLSNIYIPHVDRTNAVCCCLIGLRDPASLASYRRFHHGFPGGCVLGQVGGMP